MDHFPTVERRVQVRRFTVRFVAGLVLLVLFFSVRWDFDGTPYDFQAFRAADAIAQRDGNPYDGDVLIEELRSNPRDYSDLWANDRDGRFRVYYFNPPVWLAMIRAFGSSPLVMSGIGGVLAVVAIVASSLRRPAPEAAGYGMAAFAFLALGPADSTMHFGQTGLLVAGLVGASLVLHGTRLDGAPAAALSFKPHLALAVGLPLVVRDRWGAAARIAVPFAALAAVTLAIYGPDLWAAAARGLGTVDRPVGHNDMSLRTLVPRHTLPRWSTWPVLGAMTAISLLITHRYRLASRPVLACASLALLAMGSGHAFTHDFLWLIYVPVICAWSVRTTVAVALLAASPWWLGSSDVLWDLVELQSTLAIVSAAYLVRRARDEHRRGGRPSDDVLGREAAVHGEDRTGREHRLPAR